MIRTLDFPLQLMESFKHWRSLHGYVMFMLLAAISKGSACDAPSSPQCFRRNEEESVYVCEWSFNSNESDVTFSLNFKTCNITLRAILGTETKFGNIKANHIEIIDEELIVGSDVDMWVEAHAGNATCTSPRRSGILMHSVKYDAPHNISVSWLGNNLSLSWPAAEDYPALAEVWFQVYEHESWEKRLINTSIEASLYKVIIVNLLKSSAYRVQIRHLATKCKAPLWSNWSPVLTVPAELERELKVTNTMRLLNGTRQVTLTWEPMPHAATLGGVMYSVTDTQSSHGCPCKKKKKKKSHNIRSNPYTLYVSYSAANITVIARNAAGNSSQAIIQIPAASAGELKICDKTLLEDKLKKRTCLELYELQDADFKPESVLILTRKQKKEVKDNMKNFTRYLYFEHRCHGGKPQTVKMCHFYHKEGVPNKEPQDFTAHAETHSASLSWKEISYEHHRGFLTHYSLCIMKVGPQNEPKECFNISASVTEYDLENLTPGAEYNITLAGVTRAGEGPVATLNITTEEKPFNVWLSIGLLFVFFIFSVVCTDILKRIKNKVFPPVPVPVITEFINRHPENEQEMWDREEEVHELTLHQLPPEQTSVSEETSFLCILRGEWEDGADEDLNKERSDSAGSDDECSSLDSADQTLRKSEKTEQVDVELAMLIYRNGLVFDVKSESS